MRQDQFDRILANLAKMSPEQLEALQQAAQGQLHRTQGLAVVESVRGARGCAHCASTKTVKNGQSHGLQRYRCLACGKTFNATTNTPLARLRNKERFFQMGECLVRGLTIKQSAAELGVSITTAFRLRHRFLAEAVKHQPAGLAGLVEVDETYFRESQKGSRALKAPGNPSLARPARYHGGKPQGGKGRPSKRNDLVPVLVGRLRGQPHVADRVLPAMNKVQAKEALQNWVGPEALLCTDGSGTLRQAAAELDIPAKYTPVTYGGRVKDGVYHVQSVNRYHENLKTWINRELRGVSTKYLANYLAWMRIREWFKDDLRPEHFIASGLGKQLINT